MQYVKNILQEKYGNTKTRQVYNRAIRAEVPGGEILLDLLELTSNMKRKAYRAEEKERLRLIEDGLQQIRDEFVEGIQKVYSKEAK